LPRPSRGASAICAALTCCAGGAAGYLSGVVPAAGEAGGAAVEGLADFGAGGLGGGDGRAVEVDGGEEGADLLGGGGGKWEGEEGEEEG